VFDPVAGELFSAERGRPTTLNGTPLAIPANPPALAGATVATFVDARRRDAAISSGTDALLREVGALRAVGCGSLELAWIAAGRLHAWAQADVEPWDWHPGALLVAGAGGTARVAGRWHVAAAGAALAEAVLGAVSATPASR